MATRTFTNGGVNNLWTTAGNWDTPPVDNDTVVIAASQTCEYDGDMSNAVTWPNGIAGITVTGTLSLTRTAGTYYLKIKAAATINGAGTFDCGTSGDAIPFAAKHTITGGAAWYIQGSGGLTMTVYAAEPSIKTILLTALEPIGETVIAVNTDVTSDIWADGDTIRIDDINQGKESEERVIAAGGRAAGAITITAGLTTAKSIGAVMSLITRNVKFVGVGAAGYIARNFASGKLTIAGGQWTTANYKAISDSTGVTISGGTFSGNQWGLYTCASATISGGVFIAAPDSCFYNCTGLIISNGSFTGSYQVIYSSFGILISGGTFKGNDIVGNQMFSGVISGGTFSGNGKCANKSTLVITGGTFTSNTTGIADSTVVSCKNATFSSNTQDFSQSQFNCFNTTLASTENVLYTNLAKETYSESIDHDQTAGAFKSWTKGGVTSSQAVTLPTGYTSAMQTVLENASAEGFWQKEVTVGAGESVNITMNLRKDGAMTYLPRVIVFNKASTDPFAGGAGLHTFTMTDSVDTWEAETYTYFNSTANDVTLVIRTQGEAASGNLFSAILVEQINVDLTSALANIATIDTVVDAIKAKTDNLPSDPADESALEAAIAAIPAAPSVDDILDEAVEGAYTLRQAMRIMLASLAGRATGGGTATIVFRDINNSADRITATVDINGNRSNVVLDVA